MTYGELGIVLRDAGFDRVERDDRLLDVFPTEILEKGVELWEKWDEKQVLIVRARLPFDAKKLRLHAIPRQEVEKALLVHNWLSLINYPILQTWPFSGPLG